MKNSNKNLFKKTSTFFKEIGGIFKSTFKKHPKIFVFFVIALIFLPIISWAGMTEDAFLWFFEFISEVFKNTMVYVARAAGYIFDNILVITLSTDFYDKDWVKLSWAVLRDVANIAFIFGIIIIGIFMIIGRSQWRKMLTNLLIIVFIMNFSMFIGRVIIDAGNFTSAIFYSMMTVQNNSSDDDMKSYMAPARAILCEGKCDNWKPYYGQRAISVSLVSFVNPAELQSKDTFEEAMKKVGNDDEKAVDKQYIMVNFLIGFALLFFAKALIQGAFMLLSRMIYLIKWIILAPLYFAWYFLPGGSGKLYEWFGQIGKKSFCLTGYMIGLWVLFMFTSIISKTMLEGVDGNGNLGVLIALVGIKLIIIYKALNELTDMGTKHCEDGSSLWQNTVKGGIKKAGVLLGGATIARGVIGKAGLGIGKMSTKLHTSDRAINRYIGRLGQRAENSLYGAKIAGKSYKDEVSRSTTENAEIDARLSEEDKKKRFYLEQGGKKIKYKDGTSEKINQEVTAERAKLAEELKKKRRDPKEDKKNIKEYSKWGKEYYKKKIDEKYGEGAYEKNKGTINQVEKAWDQAHNIKSNGSLMSSLKKGAGNAVAGAITGAATAGPVGAVVGAIATPIAVGFGTAENQEASRQYLGKQALSSKEKEKQEELKKEKKTVQGEYNDKRSEINLKKDKDKKEIEISKKELSTLEGIRALTQKQIRMWDTDRDGKLDIKDKLSNAGGDVGAIISALKDSKFAPNFEGIRQPEISQYKTAMESLSKNDSAIKNKNRELQKTVTEGDIDEAKKIRKEIKDLKDISSTLSSDGIINKFTKAFEGMANQKISHINDRADTAHTSAKDSYESKKKSIDKKMELSKTQLKENQEDIAAGREARHSTSDNIVKHVQGS